MDKIKTDKFNFVVKADKQINKNVVLYLAAKTDYEELNSDNFGYWGDISYFKDNELKVLIDHKVFRVDFNKKSRFLEFYDEVFYDKLIKRSEGIRAVGLNCLKSIENENLNDKINDDCFKEFDLKEYKIQKNINGKLLNITINKLNTAINVNFHFDESTLKNVVLSKSKFKKELTEAFDFILKDLDEIIIGLAK